MSPERTNVAYATEISKLFPTIRRAKAKSKASISRDGSCNNSNGVYQILKETALVDIIQTLVEYGNSDVFRSFKVSLQMDDNNETETTEVR